MSTLMKGNNPIGIVESGGSGSVFVTADGVKTWSQLFNSLYALIDSSKMTSKSTLILDFGTSVQVFHQIVIQTGVYAFNMTSISSSLLLSQNCVIKPSDSTFMYSETKPSTGISITNTSSYTASSGTIITIEY